MSAGSRDSRRTLFVSLSGEGRGHATRIRAVVDDLAPTVRVVLYAAGDACEMLLAAYASDDRVEVRRMDCPRFAYDRRGRLNRIKTAIGGMSYLAQLPAQIARLRADIQADRPDLALVDFEPALPRAANAEKLPFISFDHQHFLTVNDLSVLPINLRAHAAVMAAFVRLYHARAQHYIVSSFFDLPIRRGVENATAVGTILRRAIVDATSTDDGHLLAYFRRRQAPARLLDSLRAAGRKVIIYGLGRQEPSGNLRFLEVNEEGFMRDLASCTAVVSNAGNQLVGEALYLRKPFLAIPEPRNHEQRINGFLLERSGCGESVEMHQLDGVRIRAFLDRRDEMLSRIVPSRYHGNPDALAAIRSALAGALPPPPSQTRKSTVGADTVAVTPPKPAS